MSKAEDIFEVSQMEELEYLPFLFVFLVFISQNASQYLIRV